MSGWFSSNYTYRRPIQINSFDDPIPEYHPITLPLSASILEANKALDSFDDIEVIYNGNAIYRDVEYFEGDVFVTFQAQERIDADSTSDDYALYMGNPNLASPPSRLPIADTDYINDPIATNTSIDEVPSWAIWPIPLPYDSARISYTRPGEHWIDGETEVAGARANARVYADRLRLICEVGPDQGIIQVRVDSEEWEEIDLYSDSTELKEVYARTNLDPYQLHDLTVLATGRSRYPSQDFKANIVKIDYNYSFLVDDLGEEIAPLSWSSYVGGV